LGTPTEDAAFAGGGPAPALRSAKQFVDDDVLERYLKRNTDLRVYGLQPTFRVSQAHPSVNGDLIPRINTGVRGPAATSPRARQTRSRLTHACAV